MDLWLLLPSFVLSIAALFAGRSSTWIHPSVTARATTVVTVAAAGACTAWAGLVFSDLVLDLGPSVDRDAALARLVLAHDRAPTWLGIAAGLWIGSAIVRIASVEIRGWLLHRSLPGSDGVVMTDASGFVAVAVPGRRSRIVMSTSAVSGCTPEERTVVIAHEWAHLRWHHARYARAARIAATLCPWLRPVERHIRFAIERWADEDAAVAVNDRRLVARTIAQLALRASPQAATLGFSVGDAAARARAMLGPPPGTPPLAANAILAGASAAATGITGSSLQLHHAVSLL